MKKYGTKYGPLWTVKRMSGADTMPDDPNNSQNPPKTDPNTDYKAMYEKAAADLIKAREDATKSYTGLQQTLTREQAAKKTVEDSLAALNLQFQEVTGIRTTIGTELEQAKEKLSVTDKELQTLRVTQSRTSLILKEFPALAEFEADGLIPMPANAVKEDGSVDQDILRNVFKNFQTKVLSMAEAKTKQYNAGGTPNQPPAGGPTTAQSFLAQANAAAAKGDTKGYNDFFTKYLEAQAKAQ